jgi:hypothetical protein
MRMTGGGGRGSECYAATQCISMNSIFDLATGAGGGRVPSFYTFSLPVPFMRARAS